MFVVFAANSFWGEGIVSFDISLEHKTILVNAESTLSYESVLAILKETGKTVHSGEANGQAREV